MAVFALVHGGAGTAALRDGVADDLSRLGREAIATDLPADDPEAGWEDYARAVESAVEDRKPGGEVIVASHPLGGFVAPLVCGRVAVEKILLVSAMRDWRPRDYRAGFAGAARDRPRDMAERRDRQPGAGR